MKKISLPLVCLLCVLSSCTVFQPRIVPDCPVIEVRCLPGTWEGTPFDTSSTGKFAPEAHWRIEQVKNANSAGNEYGFSYISNDNVLLTAGNEGAHTIVQGTLQSANLFKQTDSITTDMKGSVGATTIRGTTVVLSSLPFGNYVGDADIYTGTLKGKSVNPTKKLLSISKHVAWDAQPALSPNGNVLFFASEREGNVGGVDIWYSVKQSNGEWSAPINPGKPLNTECDEITPFVSNDGTTLLFSSNGRNSVGGYDVYSASIASEFWTAPQTAQKAIAIPVNLGAPLNTKADEIFPTTPSSHKTILYFSSNQQGAADTADFDVYVMHKVPFPKKAESTQIADNTEEEPSTGKATVKGTVRNENNQPVDNTEVKVRNKKKVVSNTTTNDSGEYSVNVPTGKDVEISVQGNEGFYDSYNVNIPNKDSNTVIQHDFVIPDKLYLRINFPFNDFQNPYTNVLDSAGKETMQKWNESLDLVAENIKRSQSRVKKVILVGHTDEVGTDDFNKVLGKNRVDFVIKELVQRGVPARLLEGQSAGESEPLARKQGEILDEYHKRNRRVELKKVMK